MKSLSSLLKRSKFPEHLKKGEAAEELACQYLKSKGLQLVEQNYHSRFGEIDLIMMDDDVLVFIEVRYRKNANYGGAASSVSYQKQQRIHKTAMIYLQKAGNTHPARFDVIAIEGDMQINWIKRAF